MIGLYAHGSDRHVRLSDIKEVWALPCSNGEVQRYQVELNEGKPLKMFFGEREALLRRPVQLIPAQPGISILRMGMDDGEFWEMREPVIAWALCLDGDIQPVSPAGVWSSPTETVHVEMPDGSIKTVTEWADRIGYENAAQMREHLFDKAHTSANAPC